MRGLFSYDGWLARILSKITDCICLSLLWLLCSLPLLTSGAATTALYYTVTKAVQSEGQGIWKSFWHSFGCNFKQCTVTSVILLFLYGILGFSLYSSWVLMRNGLVSTPLPIILLVIIATVTMWANYIFPYIARFENTTAQTLTNCAWLAFVHLLASVLFLVLFILAVVVFLLVPMGFLFAPAGYMMVTNTLYERIFQQYMPKDDLSVESHHRN